MEGITRMRRRIGVAAIALSATAAGLVVQANPASAYTKPPQTYGGYSSGVETFANLLPGAQLAKAQVAVARSAVNSTGLTPINDELGNVVSTANGDKAARALGQALDLDLVGNNVELVAPAVADAPPNASDISEDSLLEVPVPGLAFAELLEGRADARFNENGNICIIGADMANGRGQAANVQLLGSGLEPGGDGLVNPLIEVEEPGIGERNAVNTISRQLLTAQQNSAGQVIGPKIGVLSEVTQTVAPVTIAAGPLSVAIEVVGVYQLQAFAGGIPGSSFIKYNPLFEGQQPAVVITIPPTPGNILGDLLNPVLDVLPDEVGNLIQFDPATGRLLIPLGPALSLLQPVVDLLATLGIVIGEPPRAIGGAKGSAPLQRADGTASGAAIDLVRIQPAGLLAPLADVVADVRVGHMEALAFAPAGGIDCPGLGVTKVTDKDPVQVGETFTYTITATNPYDCIVRNVRVEDDITATEGITFSVGTSTPAASSVTDIAGGKRVVWNNIGDIPARGTRSVQVQVTINSATRNGRMTDKATFTGTCATGQGTGEAAVSLNLTGSVVLTAPQVGGVAVEGELPRTGRNDGIYLLLGLAFVLGLAGVETLRRRARSHT